MASLYIKDEEANRLAERLAAERGLTKTAAVKLALNHELERLPPTGRRPAIEVLEEFWSTHPLGQPTGREADKAFYDSLSDEDDL
jgi:antitoxin VapB